MAASGFDMKAYMAERLEAVEAALDAWLPPAEADAKYGELGRAMRHAVLGGGKRLRPITAIAACEAAGGNVEDALPGACAVELIHAYSLVHDDLPSMDDDDERRGKPTVHVAFDEATAILTGDALLTLAFECLGGQGAPADRAGRYLACVRELSFCCGHEGLVGGQVIDLASAGKQVGSMEDLERIHRLKTAALYRAAASLGAYLAGAEPGAQESLTRYGFEIGLAFQHADDVLDDEHRHLADASARRLAELLQSSREIAASFGQGGAPLVGLADLIEAYARSNPS